LFGQFTNWKTVLSVTVFEIAGENEQCLGIRIEAVRSISLTTFAHMNETITDTEFERIFGLERVIELDCTVIVSDDDMVCVLI
jgi:hypothetical protein